MSAPPARWERLGAHAPERLGPARQQAHWAVQTVAAAGETFLPARPDTSQTAMSWLEGPRVLAGEPLRDGGLRLGLRLAELALVLLDAERALASWPLAGHTLGEADTWAARTLREASHGALDAPLRHPGYELPPHALAEGGVFAAPDAGLAELERWFADADRLLRSWAAATPGASPVRCWPHHFDIATLTVLAAGDPESAPSVNAGLSPGDEEMHAPYAYVTPWPVPDEAALPALEGGGVWHTEGWTGAILPARTLVEAGDAGAQARRAARFLESAVAAARSLALG